MNKQELQNWLHKNAIHLGVINPNIEGTVNFYVRKDEGWQGKSIILVQEDNVVFIENKKSMIETMQAILKELTK